MRFETPDASVEVDLDHGARLSSFRVFGDELLVQREDEPFGWGSFVMAPYAGRVDRGRFVFDGEEHRLPITMPPHAIHGTVFDRPWERVDDHTVGCDLGPDWPFGGSVRQTVRLGHDRLDLELRIRSGTRSMPAMCGWHPWFRRSIGDGPPVELSFDAGAMYELDDMAIPTGALVDPPPGPWDNCFTELHSGPTLRWPGAVEVELTSSCSEWVIYTEPDHAVCVEPQTDAPDAFNRTPTVLDPGEELVATFTLRWRRLVECR